MSRVPLAPVETVDEIPSVTQCWDYCCMPLHNACGVFLCIHTVTWRCHFICILSIATQDACVLQHGAGAVIYRDTVARQHTATVSKVLHTATQQCWAYCVPQHRVPVHRNSNTGYCGAYRDTLLVVLPGLLYTATQHGAEATAHMKHRSRPVPTNRKNTSAGATAHRNTTEATENCETAQHGGYSIPQCLSSTAETTVNHKKHHNATRGSGPAGYAS